MKLLLLALLCTTSLSFAATNDWGSSCDTFDINNTKIGMDYTTVTNASASYTKAKAPKTDLKVVSYIISKVSEDRIPVGERRANVTVYIVKNVYFNKDDKVVAIEIKIANLDMDKKQYILSALDRKYEIEKADKKNLYRYRVSPDIELMTEVIPLSFVENQVGYKKPVNFGIANLYFHKTKYKEALEAAGKSVFPGNLL